MGATTTTNPRTGREVYNCWVCGEATGTVRRVPCPANWCPRSQLCPTCLKTSKADGTWARTHETCRAKSDTYQIAEALKDADPTNWAKAAWGSWYTNSSDVLVLTRGETWVIVDSARYNPTQGLREQGVRTWTPQTGIPLPDGGAARTKKYQLG